MERWKTGCLRFLFAVLCLSFFGSDASPSGAGTPRTAMASPCSGLDPSLRGPCQSYCEALDCDEDPSASFPSCQNVLSHYRKASGGGVPPCVSACPCFDVFMIRQEIERSGWQNTVGIHFEGSGCLSLEDLETGNTFRELSWFDPPLTGTLPSSSSYSWFEFRIEEAHLECVKYRGILDTTSAIWSWQDTECVFHLVPNIPGDPGLELCGRQMENLIRHYGGCWTETP